MERPLDKFDGWTKSPRSPYGPMYRNTAPAYCFGQSRHPVVPALPCKPAQIFTCDIHFPVDFFAHRVLIVLRNVTLRYATCQQQNVVLSNFFVRPENAEFKALLKVSGWKQADAARKLHQTPPVISRWLSDENPADKAAIELFKFLLASERPELLRALTLREDNLSPWESDLLATMRRLHEEDRKHVLAVTQAAIKTLPDRKPRKHESAGEPVPDPPEPSSKSDSMVQIGPHGEVSYRPLKKRRARKSAKPMPPVPTEQPIS